MRIFLALTSFSVLGMQLLIGPAAAQSPPVCIYDSKNYSDGAYICAQKSMMLTCAVDGNKATWKIVTDKDINDRCISPIARTNISEPRVRRRHYIRPVAARISPDPNAKCFHFNGKRYCE
ncbi:MAG: DUF1496 domain-containing protein [Afipia sp.]|nr:DUF1496 domain-containing protein [Afipia sp.]